MRLKKGLLSLNYPIYLWLSIQIRMFWTHQLWHRMRQRPKKILLIKLCKLVSYMYVFIFGYIYMCIWYFKYSYSLIFKYGYFESIYYEIEIGENNPYIHIRYHHIEKSILWYLICIYIFIYVCICTTDMHTNSYIYLYIHLYMYMCIYICIHI
jgi:hypothetical protein